MNIIDKKSRISTLGATAAAAAVPALLFVGAGTAQADAQPDVQTNGPISVVYNGSGPLFATIGDNSNPVGESETCSYQSVGTGLTPPIPFYATAVLNGPSPSAPVVIPGLQLGGTWDVTVSCPHGGDFNFTETY